MDSSLFSTLSPVVTQVGTSAFWPLLHGFLSEVVPNSMMGVFAYRGCEPPTRLYDTEGVRRDGVHSVLAEVGYLMSPYYHKLIRPRAPVPFCTLHDVAPDDFLESEYYHVYYAKKGVSDEGMYHVLIDDQLTVVIMVERSHSMPIFESSEVTALQDTASLVEALVKSHLSGLARQEPSSFGMQAHLGFRNMAACFGAEFLSSRERDVAMLILRGHSTKSAARELGIAPETERVHRRRLYSKLGINSHSELFWLFFEATEFFDPFHAADPLASYLRSRAVAKQAASGSGVSAVAHG